MRINAKLVTNVVPALAIASVVAVVGNANWRDSRHARARLTIAPLLGERGAPKTSREGLTARIKEMQARLAARPEDSGAAVLLADALMRQARVTGNGGLTVQAEQALQGVLGEDPGDYDAQRMLGAVYLSQHRFRKAIAAARRARDMRPTDAWNYGVMGDGHIELGEYDAAFAAFQTMMDLRPSAAAYGRAAYAIELRGDLDRALATMRMAANATTPHDPESQAWHHAQLGDLYYRLGRLDDAQREYNHANFVFPSHPFAMVGIARVTAARGEYRGALSLYRQQLERAPTLDVAAAAGDLSARLGDPVAAERYYAMAEAIARENTMSDGSLAGFLAERDRKRDEAVRLAERTAATRHDIFTEDALAWAYFKVGRFDDAAAASARAMRTGTRDRRILYHAAAIRNAVGDKEAARTLAARAIEGHPRFDPLIAPEAANLLHTLTSVVSIAQR